MLAEAAPPEVFLYPTPTQALLFQAAVLPGRAGLEAWAAWRPGVALGDLEADSQWLLPLLYWNLRQAGAAEAELRRYASVYRHNWYKNQLLLRAAVPALAALRGAGGNPLVLGGPALALAYYPALGARPIGAFTVCVRSVAAATVAAALADAGWQPDEARSQAGLAAFGDRLGRRFSVQSMNFSGAAGRRLPARARAVTVQGIAWRVLSAADQLVHVLASRAEWDERSALLWAADAARLVRGFGAADWAATLGAAREAGVEAPVRAGLRLLREGFGLPMWDGA